MKNEAVEKFRAHAKEKIFRLYASLGVSYGASYHVSAGISFVPYSQNLASQYLMK